MLTLITVTCDQPEGLALCERWVQRQTVQPDQWIVVDDGETLAHLTRWQHYVPRRREPGTTGAQSLCRNLLAAIPLVRGDRIIIIEHDDYYAPTHIERTLELLDRHGVMIAGDSQQRYYHVGRRRWKFYRNKGAALCQTGFRRELLLAFGAEVRRCLAADAYGIDAAFWAARLEREKALVDLSTVVGIKGLPGCRGLGVGHREKVVDRWKSDPKLKLLTEWIGNDAGLYARYKGNA